MATSLAFIRQTMLGRMARCIVFLALCQSVFGQAVHTQQSSQQSPRSGRDSGTLSDLEKQNLDQVAASSVQIRAILAQDAGLFVELKRWIAKEATDNGQVVRESNLSEQTIFERLDRDVA